MNEIRCRFYCIIVYIFHFYRLTLTDCQHAEFNNSFDRILGTMDQTAKVSTIKYIFYVYVIYLYRRNGQSDSEVRLSVCSNSDFRIYLQPPKEYRLVGIEHKNFK